MSATPSPEPEPGPPPEPAPPRASWRLALALFLLAALYAWPVPAAMTERQLGLAFALGHGTLALEGGPLPPRDAVRVGEHLYPTYPPLPAALVAPLLRLAEALGAPLRPGLAEVALLFLATLVLGAAMLALAFLGLEAAARAWGLPSGAARAAALLGALASPLLPYATLAYGNAVALAALALGIGALGAAARGGGERPAALAGLALGAAVLADYSALWAALPLGLCALALGRRLALALALGAAGPALLLAGFHLATSGHPLRSPNQLLAPYGQAGPAGAPYGWPRPSVLLELTVGPARGLFLYWPLLGWGAAGLLGRLRRGPRPERVLAAGLLGGALLPLLANASFAPGYHISWLAPESFGPRYALAAVPCLAAGLGPALLTGSRRWLTLAALWSALVAWAGCQTSWQLETHQSLRELLLLGPRLRSLIVVGGIAGWGRGEALALGSALLGLPLLGALALPLLPLDWRGAARRLLLVLAAGQLALALPWLALGRGQEEAVRRAGQVRGLRYEAARTGSASRRAVLAFRLLDLGEGAASLEQLRRLVEDPDTPLELQAAGALGLLRLASARDPAAAPAAALLPATVGRLRSAPPERLEPALRLAAACWAPEDPPGGYALLAGALRGR